MDYGVLSASCSTWFSLSQFKSFRYEYHWKSNCNHSRRTPGLLIAIIPWKVPTSVITGGLYCGILKNVWEK